jgi:hypothetical protein
MSSATSPLLFDSSFFPFYSLKQQPRRNTKKRKKQAFVFIHAAAAAANLGQGDLRAKSALLLFTTCLALVNSQFILYPLLLMDFFLLFFPYGTNQRAIFPLLHDDEMDFFDNDQKWRTRAKTAKGSMLAKMGLSYIYNLTDYICQPILLLWLS